MTDDELEIMKRTVNELCGVVLRLQIDLNGKPDLRDQYAMAALQGLLANPKLQQQILKTGGAKGGWIEESAWGWADAMMEARK
jgi:hypothetical protein